MSSHWWRVVNDQWKRGRRHVIGLSSLHANVEFGQCPDLVQFSVDRSTEFDSDVPPKRSQSLRSQGEWSNA